MPYSQEELEAMDYNPVAMRAYYWRVAMGAKRRSLIAKREIRERAEMYPAPGFRPIYEDDGEKHRWAEVDESVSQVILENLEAFVRSTLKRPEACEACRAQANQK